MRWLLPGGRHDRFIHSLGVYHLATRLYDALVTNSHNVKNVLNDDSLRNTFEISALMHDCGHAPFSHTTEFLYNKTCSGESHNNTFEQLKNIVDLTARSEFTFQEISSRKPADHEAMSALVLLREYKNQLEDYNVRPTLAARMITGILHSHPDTEAKKVENTLIELINGKVIDVDKLDYIVRDTWASGVKNTAIDIGRLLEATTIDLDDTDNPQLMYKATALSVIQTVIDARNYLYEWIYGHHTVLYYAELLKMLCAKLGEALAKETNERSVDSIVAKIFSDAMFSKPVSIDTKHGKIEQHLVNDGDVLALFKRYCPNASEYVSYISHKPAHIPLWKTEAEFKTLINGDNQYKFSGDQCVHHLKEKFGLSDTQCFACMGMSGKLYDIKPSALKVLMPNGKIRAYTDIANVTKHPSISDNHGNPFCYIFISKEFANQKQTMIDFINEHQW